MTRFQRAFVLFFALMALFSMVSRMALLFEEPKPGGSHSPSSLHS